MPDIALFEPSVLRATVEKLPVAGAHVLLNSVPRAPHPFPTASWDVVKGSRMVAKPNVPNSEAHLVPHLAMSQESANFIYLREKKVFAPTTLHWLRAPGTLSNTQNAEKAVMREVRDLNERFDNFAEWALWQMLQGMITLDFEDVQAVVDYKFPASHKVTVGTSWATATPAQMVDDVTALKLLINRDGRVAADTAYVTDVGMNRVFKAFAANGALLSDRSKDEYYRTGALPGFLQLNWKLVNGMYDTDAGVATQYLADDKIIIGNFTDNRPIELLEGPTADDEAPEGYTGKFAKTWKEKDPSARQHLLEWNLLPICTRPEQIAVLDIAP